jgi:NADH-quinone oxidoreductase subunit M
MYLFIHSGGSFSILEWHKLPIELGPQIWLFLAFLIAFAVKVPMWPVHTWLPDAHVEAPTGGSIVLAAIAPSLAPTVSCVSRCRLPRMRLTNCLACRRTLADRRGVYRFRRPGTGRHEEAGRLFLDRTHGLCDLGFFMFSAMGIEGALVQMVSHGFVSGAMFFCIGVMYDRVHSRQIADYGGVVNTMPKFAALFMLFTMANAGLPATSGFVGEFMVILGAVKFNFWVAFALPVR